MQKFRVIRTAVITVIAACAVASCIFSPKSEDGGTGPKGKWEDPTSPDKVINNLKLSFDELNIEFYRNCLNDNYYYLSRSVVDDIDIRWNKSEDVRTVENIMKGSTKFVFTATQNSMFEEYGRDFPIIPDGAVVVDEHPNEMWLVVNYIVDMDIFTKTFGEYNVHQYMDFKFAQDPATKRYSIVLWNDLTDQ